MKKYTLFGAWFCFVLFFLEPIRKLYTLHIDVFEKSVRICVSFLYTMRGLL